MEMRKVLKKRMRLFLLTGIMLSLVIAEGGLSAEEIEAYEPDKNTVLLMHFDEGEGLPQDSSGRGNHSNRCTAIWKKEGKIGGCLSFNGKDSYVVIPDSGGLHFNNEMTIEMWIKPFVADHIQYLFNKEREGKDGWRALIWKNTNKVCFYFGKGKIPWKEWNLGATLTTNEWNHIAVTFKSNEKAKLYINGEEKASMNVGKLTSTHLPLYIGCYSPGRYCFKGLIDEVRISNIVRKSFPGKLSEEEAALRAAERENRERGYLTRISQEVITPHVKWAKPYYKGKVKAVIFCPTTATREIVELTQRMDLNFHCIPTQSTGRFGGYDPVRESYNYWRNGPCLSEKSLSIFAQHYLQEKPEVIIIASNKWNSLPSGVRSLILKNIEKGTGLIYVNPKGGDKNLEKAFNQRVKTDEDYIFSGIPLDILPAFHKDVVSINLLGKGRVVKLNWQGILTPVPSDDKNFWQYEYYQGLLIRAILWAAKKESEIIFKPVLEKKEIFWDKVSSTPFRLSFLYQTDAVYKIKLIIRDTEEKIEYKQIKPTKPGENLKTIVFNLPYLKEGLHLLDVYLIDNKGRIINWATDYIKVKSDVSIKDIVLDKDGYKVGETIQGKIVVKGNVEDDCEAEIELLDNFNRLMEKIEISDISVTYIPFSFKLRYALTSLHKIRVTLFQKGNIISQLCKYFPVLREDEYDFKVCAWALGGMNNFSRFRFYFNRMLFQLGVDILESTGVWWSRGWSPNDKEKFENNALFLAKSNLQFLPYLTRIYPQGKGSREKPRNPSLSDPIYQESFKKMVKERAKGCKKYQIYAYSLGDECDLGNYDAKFSKDDWKSFREYLKKEYNTLEELNQTWETNFKRWEDIDNYDFWKAKENKNFSPWIDRVSFMETMFARTFSLGKESIQSIDPDAKIGFEGAAWSTTGYDWWKLLKVVDLAGIYADRPEKEYLRSFARKGSILGMWYGGYIATRRREGFQRIVPWSHLFHHLNTAMFYAADRPGASWPAFRGDYLPFPFFKWTFEEINEIKRGIGKLILNSIRDDDPIGILYSRASQFLAGCLGIRSYLGDYIPLLEQAGFQYKFISSEQIENGILFKDKYKVLILPQSLCISSKQANEIEKFVAHGGLLIADFKPGIANEHGKIRDRPFLDKVFGIGRKGSKLEKKKISTIFSKETVVEPNLLLKGATALREKEGIPLILVNKYQKGTAVYLNFVLDYIHWKWKEREVYQKARRDTLKNLLKDYAGLEPRIKLTTEDGKPTGCSEVIYFRNGKVEYVALVGANNLNVEFSHLFHIYDIRKKEYLGFTDKIFTGKHSAGVAIYGLLPYKIEKLDLRMKKRYKKGEIINYYLTLKVSESKPSTHVFRLEVYDPEGNLLRYYSKNILVASGGNYKGEIPLALNEKEGSYRIVITEVVSGKKVEKLFEVF